jgi:hypothetical protein
LQVVGGAFHFGGEFWDNGAIKTEGRPAMKRNRDRLKAEMMAQMEEIVDDLLDWHEENEAPTLTQIEDAVMELRKRVSAGMANAVVEDQEAVRPVPGPACAECGEEMHYKGMKEVTVETRTGAVDVLRAYYYCDRCRRGLFPPGSTTEP